MIRLTPSQQAHMTQCFGAAFVQALPQRLGHYARLWRLTRFSLIEYYSVNCLLTCHSQQFGDCVLKIFGCQYKWYIDEIRLLTQVDGAWGYVRAHACDEAGGALLLERIRPGTTLKSEASLGRRIAAFGALWNSLNVKPQQGAQYETYLETARQAEKKQHAMNKHPQLVRLAPLMVSVCEDLYRRYPTHVLLHADLHGDNLLLDASGRYRIVDPHGRIGPRICDLGRYIANEYEDAAPEKRAAVTGQVVDGLSGALGLPRQDVIRAFFVDITLMTCWDSEDGTANPQGALFAETMLAD